MPRSAGQHVMDDERVRYMRGCVEMMQAMVEGLQDRVAKLEAENRALRAENAALRRRVEQLTTTTTTTTTTTSAATTAPPSSPPSPACPPFVKPNAPPGRRKRPGRPKGHPAALRPPPRHVDRTVEAPLPTADDHDHDHDGRPCCPDCRTPLRHVRSHRRLVEDVVPAHVEVTRYRTASGFCPHCRRRVESRHPDQPPAASLPHAQVGVNALAAAAVLRAEHRLPMRQVSAALAGLTGLRVCAGAVAKQVQRVGRWLAGECGRVTRRLRASPAVNADETGWRTAGRNGFLWAACGPRHTLYHLGPGRGGDVIRSMLGADFGGTLVSDFLAAYGTMPGPKQRCLVHLLRELRDLARDSPAFAACPFYRRCRRLLEDMLALKRRWRELDDETYTRRACRLEDRLTALAGTAGTWGEQYPDADRLAARLRRHGRELTPFLWDADPYLDGTNNAAERALRPAVVMRKVTGGSRSRAGAEGWAVLASVLRTAKQQRRDPIGTLTTLFKRHWAGLPPGLLARA